MLRWAVLLMAWPAMAQAFGGSQSTWLGGTLPWDTVPFLEADPQVLFESGSGAPVLGAAVDAGITDLWMAQGAWAKPLDGGASAGRLASRLRLHQAPFAGMGAAAYGGVELPEGQPAVWVGGLILAYELEGHSLSLDVEARRPGAPLLSRAGYRTPYIYYGLRLALEAALDSAGMAWTLPALAYNLPGDLSVDLGLRLPADGSGAWRVQSRLSFQLFPSP